MTTISATTSDGVRIAIHDLGGAGEPLLLVHGAGLCGQVFSPLARSLRQRWHILALDLRGHGQSERPDPPNFSWDRFALDVECALGVLDSERPFAVGHSLGAVALLFAEAARPSSFSSLHCYEPPLLSQTIKGATRQRTIEISQRRATFGSREEAFRHYRTRGMFAEFVPEALEGYVRDALIEQDDGTVRLVLSPEDEASIYTHAPLDHFDDLRAVHCPVTIAYGTESSAPARQFVDTIVDHLPHGELESFPGLGHFGPMQDPGVLAASIIHTSETPTS